MKYPAVALLVMAAALSSCTQPTPPVVPPLPPLPPLERQGESVQTDRLVYAFDGASQVTVVAAYTNATEAPVYYERCAHIDGASPVYSHERLFPERGTLGIGDVGWACSGDAPRGVVPPGETLRVDTTVHLSGDISTTPDEHWARLRVDLLLYDGPTGSGEALSKAQSHSNVFEVRYRRAE